MVPPWSLEASSEDASTRALLRHLRGEREDDWPSAKGPSLPPPDFDFKISFANGGPGHSQGGDITPLVQGMDRKSWISFVSHIAGLPNEPGLGPALLSLWLSYGYWSIPEALRDDLPLYVVALRRHLPPYDGPPVTLYRGELAAHYYRGAMGIAWTTSLVHAGIFSRIRTYTDEQGGHEGPGVVLKVEAPPSSIVVDTPTYGHTLKEGEREYIIDPRMIDRDQVSIIPASEVPDGRYEE